MKTLSPWFSFPLSDWRKSVGYVQGGVRSLKDPQIAAELEELRGICEAAPDDLAARLILKVYRDEAARRADPLRQFDDELNQVLDRLERQTTPEDRQRLSDIGLTLCTLGGGAALRAAYDRMLSQGVAKRRHIRAGILERRWSVIAPFMEGKAA